MHLFFLLKLLRTEKIVIIHKSLFLFTKTEAAGSLLIYNYLFSYGVLSTPVQWCTVFLRLVDNTEATGVPSVGPQFCGVNLRKSILSISAA